MINRSQFVRGLLVSAALGMGAQAMAQSKMDDVSVQLDWVVRADHAMFFVGKEKGFFEKNNINVTSVRKGTGSTDALRLVANGNAQFGFADLPTLLVVRSRSVPVKAIAAVNQKSPMALIALKEKRTLSSPSDIKGLNIGVHSSGSTYVFLKAFLAANGMGLNDIKQSTVAPPYESFLVLGRVDAVPGYLNAEVPELESKTGGAGSLSVLPGADFGYKAYGSGLFTSEKLIANNPDLVQRFTKAYLQAFEYVINHPKEAVDIIVKHNPEYKEKSDLLQKQMDFNVSKSFTNTSTQEKGLGVITLEQWKETAQTLIDQDLLPKDTVMDAGFDNSFQQKSGAAKK